MHTAWVVIVGLLSLIFLLERDGFVVKGLDWDLGDLDSVPCAGMDSLCDLSCVSLGATSPSVEQGYQYIFTLTFGLSCCLDCELFGADCVCAVTGTTEP